MMTINNEKIVDQWTNQVDSFATSNHVNIRQPIDIFIDALNPKGIEHALDVGCGPGIITNALASKVKNIIGVDLTPAMIEKAKETSAESSLNNIQFEIADASSLPFPDNSFDMVVTRLTIHHYENPLLAIKEMSRVLKPSGILGVFDMLTSEDSDESKQHNAFEKFRDPGHVRTLPMSELIHDIGISNLEIRSIQTLNHDFNLDDYFKKIKQTKEEEAQGRQLLEEQFGLNSYLGRRYKRSEESNLSYTATWGITIAQKNYLP